MSRSSRLLRTVALGGFLAAVFLTQAGATESTTPDCEENLSRKLLVEEDDVLDTDSNDHYRAVALAEEHSLMELVDADPSKNLVIKYPSLAMNAPQRILAIVNKMGQTQAPHPHNPNEQVTLFGAFEKGGEESGGRAVIGNYEVKQKFVNNLKLASSRDASGRNLLVLLGPAGTGKSELAEVVARELLYFSLRDPESALLVPVFKNLRQITEIRRYIDLDDEGNEPEIVLPYPDFPIALLPEKVQKTVTSLVADKIQELTGTDLNPVTEPGAFVAPIRDAILAHYSKKLGRALTTRENIEYLDKHITLRRLVLFDGQAAPIIDAKEGDFNWRGLAIGENPLYVGDPNPRNPFKWDMGGKLLQGNGSITFLDEYFRNHSKVRNATLGIIEGRRVSFETGPSVPLDVFLYAASNSESLAKIIGEGASLAQQSRIDPVTMKWSVFPHEIMEVALLMNRGTLFARRLGVSHSSSAAQAASESEDEEYSTPVAQVASEDVIEKVKDFKDLFPMPQFGSPVLGPDGRYALYFGTGKDRVSVSPHALMLMSYVSAATRISTDAKAAMEKYPNASVIRSVEFSDVITRLKILTHSREVSHSVWRELSELSTLLGEGEFGIDMRHVGRQWMTTAIAMAREPGNEHTLTPFIIKKAFIKLLRNKGIASPNNGERLRWERLMDWITVELVVPSIINDISKALGSRDGTALSLYNELMSEIITSVGNASHKKSDMYVSIEAIYAEVNREQLNPSNLNHYAARRAIQIRDGVQPAADRPHPGLMNAVYAYLARSQMNSGALSAVVDAVENSGGTMSSTLQEQVDSFIRVMKYELGYSSTRAIKEAVRLVQDAEKKKRELRGQE